MVYQCHKGIGSITLVPVITVTKHDADLGFIIIIIYIIAGAVPDMFAVQRLDGQREPVLTRPADDINIVQQIHSKRELEYRSGIETG